MIGGDISKLLADTRMGICKSCDLYDITGYGCEFEGTEPCCNLEKGGCGCALKDKVWSLHSSCPLKKWGGIDDSI